MKHIKEYLDYRDFLSDFYEDRKRENPFFSYRYISGKLSIDASHLFKIFQKQRHISVNNIDVFLKFCKLSGTDAEYFTTLVRFNKAKSDQDSKFFFEKLLTIKGVKAHTLDKNQYEYYSKWYHAAILTLLDFYKFSDDYKALGGKLSPPITEAQARESVALLSRLDMIKKGDDGSYKLTHKIITTGDHCRSIAVKAYQQETIKLAGESLERHAKELRNISTVTITISEKSLDSINDMIKEFRQALLKHAESETEADRVYQLNIQLFPLSQ